MAGQCVVSNAQCNSRICCIIPGVAHADRYVVCFGFKLKLIRNISGTDSGTILPGITRDSVIQLLKKWGVKVSERKLSIDEVVAASKDGSLQEIFASGTAAVISPIGWLNVMGTDVQVADGTVGPVAQKLYDTLYGMQTGTIADDMGWTYRLL